MSNEDKKAKDEERLGMLEGSLKGEGFDTKLVNVYEGKPGLDDKEGKYRVLGAVSANPIATRKGPETNIAKACGYHVEEIETGRKLKMTKKEGVNIAAIYGMRNAYIVYRPNHTKDEEGNIIKTNPSIYLQPFPPRKEAFTQDDRLVTVYKLDEDGKIEEPLELMITEEECTMDFWKLIEQMFEKKKQRKRKANRKKEEDDKRHHQIRQLEKEIEGMGINNPFKY